VQIDTSNLLKELATKANVQILMVQQPFGNKGPQPYVKPPEILFIDYWDKVNEKR